jgi:polysaccharide export outer membrane protein
MNPGVIKFKSHPNLLEALAKAGAFPTGTTDRRFTRCDIIRGKDQMLRVSIDELLRGSTGGRNIDLANNDIIYIPDIDDNNVYIMGEIAKPGAYEIRTSMSLLNAVMLAGGPTENAVTDGILLVRDRGKDAEPLKVSLDRMVNSADYGGNVLLARNDIIYVPRRGIADFNYFLRMINPFTQMLFFGTTFIK